MAKNRERVLTRRKDKWQRTVKTYSQAKGQVAKDRENVLTGKGTRGKERGKRTHRQKNKWQRTVKTYSPGKRTSGKGP